MRETRAFTFSQRVNQIQCNILNRRMAAFRSCCPKKNKMELVFLPFLFVCPRTPFVPTVSSQPSTAFSPPHHLLRISLGSNGVSRIIAALYRLLASCQTSLYRSLGQPRYREYFSSRLISLSMPEGRHHAYSILPTVAVSINTISVDSFARYSIVRQRGHTIVGV